MCAIPSRAAQVSWITEANGFWDMATNWSPGPPGIDDDVIVDVAGARVVTLRTTGGPFVVNSLIVAGDDALTITSGSLTITGLPSADNVSGASSLARLTQSGGSLGGSGQLTVVGSASLTGSTHTGGGSTIVQGTTAISGFNLDAGRTLRNLGTATLTGGMNLNATNAAGTGRIENAAGALFDVRTYNLSITAGSFTGDPGAGASISNAGTFRKSTAGGYGVAVPFANLATGVIDIQAGSFNFTGGGSYDGAVTLAANAGLTLGGGTHHVGAGASFSGPGTLALFGASTVLQLMDSTDIDSGFTMTGGTVGGAALTLRGPYSLTISSSLGVLRGPTTTTLVGDGSVGGGPNNPFGLDAGHVLRNQGSMVVTGVLNLNRLSDTGSGRIENAAGALIDVRTFNQSIYARDWTATNPLDSGADARVDNAGTFRKSTTGAYSVLVPFFNTGTVEVLAGEFNIPTFGNGGVLDVAAGASFRSDGLVNEGRIQGNGTIVASGAGVINSGTIGPGNSTGHLMIDGNLQMASDGVVSIELGGLSQFDLLTVTGDATLGGELDVIRTAGYSPAVGDSFIVMTFNGRQGTTFDSLRFLGFGDDVLLAVSYRDHEVVLGVTAVPEPAVWAMLLSGLGLLGVVIRRGPHDCGPSRRGTRPHRTLRPPRR